MLHSYVSFFRTATEELQGIKHSILSSGFEKEAGEAIINRVKPLLEKLVEICSLTDLDATKHLAGDLLEQAHVGMNTTELDAKLASIQSMARKELQDKQFFYVPADKASYYRNKKLCGKLVAKKFKHAVPDIIQAGNCYALNLPTACVFHLMRVIPYGMAVLAKRLKVKYNAPIETLMWGSIIQSIDKAVQGFAQHKKTKKRIEDQRYYSEIVTHLYYCKDAWRNHVSHSPEHYDMPQAKSVFDHVGRVMGMLAKKM